MLVVPHPPIATPRPLLLPTHGHSPHVNVPYLWSFPTCCSPPINVPYMWSLPTCCSPPIVTHACSLIVAPYPSLFPHWCSSPIIAPPLLLHAHCCFRIFKIPLALFSYSLFMFPQMVLPPLSLLLQVVFGTTSNKQKPTNKVSFFVILFHFLFGHFLSFFLVSFSHFLCAYNTILFVSTL